MEIARTKDTGTLQYEIYINEDENLATGSVHGELLGEPSADLRAQLAGSPVRLFTPYLTM
jgi:hypothetical protein